jgi:hypothetical protein
MFSDVTSTTFGELLQGDIDEKGYSQMHGMIMISIIILWHTPAGVFPR